MTRIRGELPQFKRCRMCLPLRHGLIACGYVRLVLLAGFTKDFFEMLARSKKEAGYEVNVVMFGFYVIVEWADIMLNVVFVYAGHTINLKMLKAYYIYNFVLWILMIILGLYLTVHDVHVMKLYDLNLLQIWSVLCDVATFLVEILIQAYVLLQVRSEFIKLTMTCEFRFVNKGAESACQMKCEEDAIASGDIPVIDNTGSIVNGDVTANSNNIFNVNYEIRYHGVSESKVIY